MFADVQLTPPSPFPPPSPRPLDCSHPGVHILASSSAGMYINILTNPLWVRPPGSELVLRALRLTFLARAHPHLRLCGQGCRRRRCTSWISGRL